MLFPTIEFILFFIFSFIIYNSINHNENKKLILISAFNFIFYSYYNFSIFIYLLFWIFSIWLVDKKPKLYKYFIAFALCQLAYWKLVDAHFIEFRPFSTPLGISFFTFQGLTYIFARMKLPKRFENEHLLENWSFIKLFAFVGFFPTIFSGPILRAKNWENNLKKEFKLNQQNFNLAIMLIAIGTFYKLCISSYFHDFVSLAFSNPSEEIPLNLIIGMFAYTFEIYHDFAGYSLMAIGIALLYGFEIPPNFKQPYLAFNIRDFWQRWHISFSTWLRDYFYISFLGGSKNGQFNHIRNSLIIMIVCGAWHGLSLNYLLWGLFHGLAIVVFHLTKDKLSLNKYISWTITFSFVSIVWLFFRSPDAKTAFDYIFQMFNFNELKNTVFSQKDFFVIILFLICLIIQFIEFKLLSLNLNFNSFIFGFWIAPFFWSIIFIIILILSPSGLPPFIYFSY